MLVINPENALSARKVKTMDDVNCCINCRFYRENENPLSVLGFCTFHGCHEIDWAEACDKFEKKDEN